jgi:hypothetical protein
MTAAITTFGGMSGLIATAHSTAQSDSARELFNMQKQIRDHLLSSYAISNPAERALAALKEVRSEAFDSGWDGYNAEPLDPPTTTPTPEVSADSDGEVSFDWIFGERKALTVSISPTGRCTYAWMLGQRTSRGTEWFEDEIPAPIVFALGQLAHGASTKLAK